MADPPDNALTCDDFLGGGLRIWQPKKGYRAATDPVLLAAACPAKRGETALDLGCGVGVAGLCLARRTGAIVTGLELQESYARLAKRNAKENCIPLKVITGDLSQMPPALKAQSFDHVLMNPPFFGPGAKAPDPGRATARQEETNLQTWIDSGLKRLKPKGHLTVIHLVERLTEVIVALENRAGAIKILPLAPRRDRPPTRFVLTAKKGARTPPFLANPLILHDGLEHEADRNDFSEAAEQVLRHGKSLEF